MAKSWAERVVKTWEENGVKHELMENGNVWVTIIKFEIIGNPCQPGYRLVTDKDYNETVAAWEVYRKGEPLSQKVDQVSLQQ